MPDQVNILYNGVRLQADLVALVPTAETAKLYAAQLDTNGGIVPVWKAHSYTYDANGNLSTDTVTDGFSTWIRTYTTGPTGTTADSGWVKQ